MQSYCLLLLLIQVTGSWRIIHDRNHTSTLLLFNDRGWHFMQISKEDWPEKTVPSFFYKTIIGHTYGPPSHAANLATPTDVNVKFKLLLSQQQSIASLKPNRSAWSRCCLERGCSWANLQAMSICFDHLESEFQNLHISRLELQRSCCWQVK